METVYRITLFIAGVINFMPSLLVFFPDRISKAYGIDVPDGNVELVLRHRAVLFGIVGALMIISSLTKKYYAVATIAGLVSLVSFLLLYMLIDGPINQELRTVMQIDVFATVTLLVGVLLFLLRSRP